MVGKKEWMRKKEKKGERQAQQQRVHPVLFILFYFLIIINVRGES
jgi:hypothetical protein